MSRYGQIAGLMTLVEGCFPLYIVFFGGNPFLSATSCVFLGCPSPTFSQSFVFQLFLVGLGLLLVFDGVLGTWGVKQAYLLGLVLSLAFLLATGYAYLSDSQAIASHQSLLRYQSSVIADEVALVVLSAAGVVANLVPVRKKSRLPEQVNPMNLPVFG